MNRFFNWRALAILGFILATVAITWLLYSVFFGGAAPSDEKEPTGPITNLPTVPTGEPTTRPETPPTRLPGEEIVEEETVQPSPIADGGLTATEVIVPVATNYTSPNSDGRSLNYYNINDGSFYRVTNDGEIKKLSDATFFNVDNVTWSPERNRAVLEYPDGANVVYNFDNDTQVTLPKHWEDFSFNPDGKELAFKSLGIDRDSRWLGISNSDGTASQAIEPLGENENQVIVDWSPSRQIVALQHVAIGADTQEIFMIGLNNENFRSMTAPGVGLRTQWTPDGQRLLYSVSSASTSYKPLLWIADAAGENIGQNRRSLGLNTWADKCTFASVDRLICAVPKTLPDGAGLAPGVALSTSDNLYELNLSNGQRKLLAIPANDITVSALHLTSDGRTLFVQDELSGNIHRINL